MPLQLISTFIWFSPPPFSALLTLVSELLSLHEAFPRTASLSPLSIFNAESSSQGQSFHLRSASARAPSIKITFVFVTDYVSIPITVSFSLQSIFASRAASLFLPPITAPYSRLSSGLSQARLLSLADSSRITDVFPTYIASILLFF